MKYALVTCLAACVLLTACSPTELTVSGVVQDADGPVEGATVRVQATERTTTTDAEGRFALTVSQDETVSLAAWAPGYYIAGGDTVAAGARDVQIELVAIAETDDPAYAWLPSTGDVGEGEGQACAVCHSREGTLLGYDLPVDQWRKDAHSQSATNPRFLSMYSGTDLAGNQSPRTRYAPSKDYGLVPIRPDEDAPYYGPGYRLDFPDTAGNCGACHVPVAAIDDPYGVDPRTATGVAAEGVTCDFCHKISGVALDDVTGLPNPGMPGVLSLEFRRPSEGHQYFAGPFDDVAPGEDTYLALESESAFCAPCHYGVFWDVVVYDSFGEWLRSPYSDPDTGQTCQNCHMPPSGAPWFARPDMGGRERVPETIPAHLMPGAVDRELLENAVTMTVAGSQVGDEVRVEVEILNDGTGHHVPTDSPLRHLLLVVTAVDENGSLLAQSGGPTVPEWGGVGDPAAGYYAGLPGTAYAKVLEERWTGVAPTGAYWMQTFVRSDNRIPAFGADVTEYVFAAPGSGTVTIDVRLVFRRAYIDLADLKGWDVPDIDMARETVTVSR